MAYLTVGNPGSRFVAHQGDTTHPLLPSVATTLVLGVAVFAVLVGSRFAPVHAAVMALGVAIALPIHVAGAWMKARR